MEKQLEAIRYELTKIRETLEKLVKKVEYLSAL